MPYPEPNAAIALCRRRSSSRDNKVFVHIATSISNQNARVAQNIGTTTPCVPSGCKSLHLHSSRRVLTRSTSLCTVTEGVFVAHRRLVPGPLSECGNRQSLALTQTCGVGSLLHRQSQLTAAVRLVVFVLCSRQASKRTSDTGRYTTTERTRSAGRPTSSPESPSCHSVINP